MESLKDIFPDALITLNPKQWFPSSFPLSVHNPILCPYIPHEVTNPQQDKSNAQDVSLLSRHESTGAELG